MAAPLCIPTSKEREPLLLHTLTSIGWCQCSAFGEQKHHQHRLTTLLFLIFSPRQWLAKTEPVPEPAPERGGPCMAGSLPPFYLPVATSSYRLSQLELKTRRLLPNFFDFVYTFFSLNLKIFHSHCMDVTDYLFILKVSNSI